MSWQHKHNEVIDEFLKLVNSRTDRFILKGGTAFAKCYNLDRFSEDIDFDAGKSDLTSQVKQFCKFKNYSYREQKKKDYTQRFFINYGNNSHPLKVETSTREKLIDKRTTTKINGIAVYNLDTLTILKAAAYKDRDKIRDLYDLVFVINNYNSKLSSQTKILIKSEFKHKGLEQFDYLIKTQSDKLIDNDKFANDILLAFDKLGLLYTENEKKELLNTDFPTKNINTNSSQQSYQPPNRADLPKSYQPGNYKSNPPLNSINNTEKNIYI
jgi:predicted nucleotidyltransferase component of viral defense system